MKNKKLGIWGFGTVGVSAVQFLSHRCKYLSVLDTRSLTAEQFGILAESNAKFIHQKSENDLLTFLESHDYIVPSPGIDLRPYAQYAHKWLPEVDIFKNYATIGTIVAITGTVGKTTVTTQLEALLSAHGTYSAAVGNIGTPLLALMHWIDPIIEEHVEPEVGVIELSSFQLEHNHSFAPDLGILTNIYPNHLDRHDTLETYLAAKMNLFLFQNDKQKALLPAELIPQLKELGYLDKLKAQLNFFTLEQTPTQDLLNMLPGDSNLFYYDGTAIHQYNQSGTITIVELPQPLKGTRAINWLICFAAYHLLELGDIYHTTAMLQNLEHRIEHVATVDGVTFINDSKATIAQSTLAAVRQIDGPIILLLGGLSKGVDRMPYLAELPATITHIICFGKEAEVLKLMCDTLLKTCTTAETLEDAYEQACTLATEGSTVLLSPGGSSYDLFKNYEERGNCFKKLVMSRQ